MTTIETLKSEIRKQDTQTIFDCIIEMGGDQLPETERMVRACLMHVYEERTSGEELDALLDVLGM